MSVQENGAGLVTTLGMIMIFTLVVFSMMQALSLPIKVSHQMIVTHEKFYELELVAHKLSQTNRKEDCVFTGVDMNQMIVFLKEHRGCLWIENKQEYEYLIDDLGIFPCLPMLVNNERVSSHHWVITVASAASLQIVLQLRIAQPSRMARCDDFEADPIKKGVVSWRYTAR